MTSQLDAIRSLIDTLPERDRVDLLATYAPPAAPKSLRLLRPVEAARAMGVSTTTLWRLRREGRIESVEVRRGSQRIREAAIQRFVEERA